MVDQIAHAPLGKSSPNQGRVKNTPLLGAASKTESSDSLAFGNRAGVSGRKPSKRAAVGAGGAVIPVAQSCQTSTSSGALVKTHCVAANLGAGDLVHVVLIGTEPSRTAGMLLLGSPAIVME